MFVDGLLMILVSLLFNARVTFLKAYMHSEKYCFYAYNEYTEKWVPIWERKKEKEMGKIEKIEEHRERQNQFIEF